MESTSTWNRLDSLETRSSLLERIRDARDEASWQAFMAMYQGFVIRIARSGGLGEHEAEDVAQEVLIKVSRTIHRFEVRRPRGAFRRWLTRLARWRTADNHRKVARRRLCPHWGSDETGSGTDPIERVPAPVVEPALLLEQEAREKLVRMGLQRLQPKFKAENLQIYDWYVVQGVEVRATDLQGLGDRMKDLAGELDRRGLGYRSFDRWSGVAEALLAGR